LNKSENQRVETRRVTEVAPAGVRSCRFAGPWKTEARKENEGEKNHLSLASKERANNYFSNTKRAHTRPGTLTDKL